MSPKLLLLAVLAALALPGCAKEECPACNLTCPEAQECAVCPACTLSCPAAAEIPACPACPATSPGPVMLADYASLMSDLREGRRVRAVLDYARCTLGGSPGPAAVGAMSIDTFEWFDAGVVGNLNAYVTFSETKFINYAGNYVNNYVKVRIYSDNSATVTAEYVNPTTLAFTMSEKFTCAITASAGTPKGVTLYGL